MQLSVQFLLVGSRYQKAEDYLLAPSFLNGCYSSALRRSNKNKRAQGRWMERSSGEGNTLTSIHFNEFNDIVSPIEGEERIFRKVKSEELRSGAQRLQRAEIR